MTAETVYVFQTLAMSDPDAPPPEAATDCR
jgi:hypothetical protein